MTLIYTFLVAYYMTTTSENIHIIRLKYGEENCRRLLSYVGGKEDPVLIDRIVHMNLLYDDAVEFAKMYAAELRLLNLECLFDDTRLWWPLLFFTLSLHFIYSPILLLGLCRFYPPVNPHNEFFVILV